MPIRNGKCDVPFKARLTATAQRAGASGLVKKTSIMPLPRRNSHQFVLRFSGAKLPRVADEPIQLLLPLTLLVGKQL